MKTLVKQVTIKFSFLLLVTAIVFSIFTYNTITVLKENIISKVKYNVMYDGGVDLQTLANTLNCSYINYKNICFEIDSYSKRIYKLSDKPLFKEQTFIIYKKHNLYMTVTIGEYEITIYYQLCTTLRPIILTSLLQLVLMLIVLIIIEYKLQAKIEENELLNTKIISIEMQNNTQVKLAETLYHEVNIPMATLKVLVPKVAKDDTKTKRILKDIYVIFESVDKL